MTAVRKDPLLTITLVITRVIIIVLVLLGLVLLGALAYALAQSDAAILSQDSQADPAAFRMQISLVAVIALVGFGFAIGFMLLLSRIIKSVGEGSPFVMDNVRRLTGMAWCAIGFQTIAVVVTLVDGPLNRMMGRDELPTDVDIAGFVLALTLFVLARVFERGAAMQDDLEGTV